MLAGTPTSGNSVSSCCELLIASSSPDTFSLNFTAMSRRSHGPVTFFMNATINEDVTGTWQLQGSNRTLGKFLIISFWLNYWFDCVFNISGPFKHRVIAVNYDSYVVMVVCGENNPDLPLHGFSMILARNKNLSSTILEEQKKILSVYFSRDMIIDVDHNNC